MVLAIFGARLLGTEAFGTYVSYLAMATLVATGISAGLPTLLAREIAIARGTGGDAHLRPLAQLILAVHGLVLTALLGFALFASLPALWILGFAFANNVLAVVMHVFIGFERVLLSQWVGSVLRPLLLLAGFLIVACIGTLSVGVAMMLQIGAALICAAALGFVWLANRAAISLQQIAKSTPVLVDYSSALWTGGKFAFAQLAIMGMTQVDILILTATRSTEEVAWYFAAARAALVVSFFFSSVTKLAEPKLVRLHAANAINDMRSLAISTAWLGFGTTVAAFVIASLVGGFYFDLFGEDYRNAYPAMVILMCGLLARSFFGPAEAVMRASRSDNRVLVYAVISLSVGATIAYSLVLSLGMTGVAIGMAVQFGLFGFLLSRRALAETGIKTTIIGSGRQV